MRTDKIATRWKEEGNLKREELRKEEVSEKGPVSNLKNL